MRAAAVAVLLLAAAAAAAQDPAASRASDLLHLPTVPPPIESILAVDEEMRAFAAELRRKSTTPKDRLDELVHVLLDRRGLGIRYGKRATLTAAQTFTARTGNCISFTNLFVALARELGFRAYFSEVDQIIAQDQRGEMIVNNKHMYATVEIENGWYHVDFGQEAGGYQLVNRVSDRRAAAHYYNNLGAELLVQARAERAVPFFERAVELEPELAEAWVNQGVAHRRLGQPERAEACYREAARLDGSELPALWNLSLLLEEQGRAAEAEEIRAKVESYKNQSPFHHFNLGVEAVRAGQMEEAVRRFRQAIRRAPKEPELHFALGDAYYRLGDTARALGSMRRALALADRSEKREHYRAAIQALERLEVAAEQTAFEQE